MTVKFTDDQLAFIAGTINDTLWLNGVSHFSRRKTAERFANGLLAIQPTFDFDAFMEACEARDEEIAEDAL